MSCFHSCVDEIIVNIREGDRAIYKTNITLLSLYWEGSLYLVKEIKLT